MTNKHSLLLSASALVSFLLLFIPVSSLYYDPTVYHGQDYTLWMGQSSASLPTEHSVSLFKSPYSYVPSTAWHYVAMGLNYIIIIMAFVAAFARERRRIQLVATYFVVGLWCALIAMFMFAPFVDVRELSLSPISYFGIGGQAMLDNAEHGPCYVAVALALSALACTVVAANTLKQAAASSEQTVISPGDLK
jgi:hypothetical protein